MTAYELTSTPKTFTIKESVKLMRGEELFFEQEESQEVWTDHSAVD